MGDERSRSAVAGTVVALQPAGMCAGTRLAPGRDVAMLRLLAGGTGATLRPQRELGVATAGTGATAAGNDSTAGAGRQDRGTNSDEVSGADGAAEGGGLPAIGRSLCPAPL